MPATDILYLATLQLKNHLKISCGEAISDKIGGKKKKKKRLRTQP